MNNDQRTDAVGGAIAALGITLIMAVAFLIYLCFNPPQQRKWSEQEIREMIRQEKDKSP